MSPVSPQDYDFASSENHYYKIVEYTEIKYGILLLTKEYAYKHQVSLIKYEEGFGGRETPDWSRYYYLREAFDYIDAKRRYTECTNPDFNSTLEMWMRTDCFYPISEWIRKPIV